MFELISGLSINFNNLSIYQVGLPRLALAQVSSLLHYNMGSFLPPTSAWLLSTQNWMAIHCGPNW